MRYYVFFLAILMGVSALPANCAGEKHPAEKRQVSAEGEAPADDPDAKDHALADALRNAVMTGVGVLVESTTIAEDYKIIQNDILTKSSGFAVLDKINSVSVEEGLMTIKITATVSMVPLAEQLRDSGLLHDWKVAVFVPETYTSKPKPIPDPAAETAIMQKIKDAGFRLIDESRRKELAGDDMAERAAKGDVAAVKSIMKEYDVDIFVAGQAFAEYIDEQQEGGVNFFRTRGRIEARAYYMDTAELLSITEAFANGLDQSENLSAKQCFKSAGREVGSKIATDLLIAPASQNQFVIVKITGFSSLTSAGEFGKALKKLPGVGKVTSQRYTKGTQEWNVYVKSDYRDSLPDKIESCEMAKKLGIRMDICSKTYIQGHATR